jgi:hypothetical protein
LEYIFKLGDTFIPSSRSVLFVLGQLALALLLTLLAVFAHANTRIDSTRTTRALEHLKQEAFHALVNQELKRRYDLGDENLEYKRRLIGALRLIMSKRDAQDGIFRIEYGEIRPKLDEFEGPVLRALIEEAASAISDSSEAVTVRATYVTILDNMLSVIEKKASDYQPIIAKIKDLKIEFDGPLKSYFFNVGHKMKSPSLRAEKMIPQKG